MPTEAITNGYVCVPGPYLWAGMHLCQARTSERAAPVPGPYIWACSTRARPVHLSVQHRCPARTSGRTAQEIGSYLCAYSTSSSCRKRLLVFRSPYWRMAAATTVGWQCPTGGREGAAEASQFHFNHKSCLLLGKILYNTRMKIWQYIDRLDGNILQLLA